MSNKADYKLIGKSTVCSEITEDEAKILAEAMGVRELKDGELLVSEGEADHTLYILASGKLGVISAAADGKQNLVHTMIAGECAGTRAFVDHSPRRATLRAVGKATVYMLTPEAFDTVVDNPSAPGLQSDARAVPGHPLQPDADEPGNPAAFQLHPQDAGAILNRG